MDTDDSGEEHPLVGHVLADRYRIDALLGEGGMGAVFRATHLSLDRPVAVKLLHPRLTDDEQVSKRFEREALAASKLDHPGCVQVIDFGTSRKGMKYLVMQYLDGKELRELTGEALPLPQVIDVGDQILRALEHAHKRGLVHRDLKPENIFLVTGDDGETRIKLVDFGIVKLLEAAGMEKLTRMGMAFGTPAYMSPEQAAGGTIDPRTDLYAVGILLYEMLTGDPPFEADEPGILLRMQILSEPSPLPESVPPAVAKVVLTLLSKDADERYPSARAAREALVAAMETKPAPAAAASVPAVEAPTVALAPVEPDTAQPDAAPPDTAPPDAAQPDASPERPGETSNTASRTPASTDPAERTVAEPVVPVRSGSTVPGEDEADPAPGSRPTGGASKPVVPVRSGSTVPGQEDAAGESRASGSDAAQPIRSGGTVVAGSSTAHGAVPLPAPSSPPVSTPHSAAPIGSVGRGPSAGSVAHGGSPQAGSSMNHGHAMHSTASASMSHGVGPAGSAVYDPLAISNAHMSATGSSSAMYMGGPQSTTGDFGVIPPPAEDRRSSRRNAIALVLVGVLVAWGLIAVLWMSSRGNEQSGAEGASPGAAEGESADAADPNDAGEEQGTNPKGKNKKGKSNKGKNKKGKSKKGKDSKEKGD
ncbi:MAG: protein kinase [Myxococcota bacterium]